MGNSFFRGGSKNSMEQVGMEAMYYGRCPKCASKEIQRSRRRNILERAIGPVALPWRCNVCYVRFFRPFWFKAEPRRIDFRRHFAQPVVQTAQRRRATEPALLRWSEQALPGFIKRNPALAFLIPARSHVRHVEHAVPFGTK